MNNNTMIGHDHAGAKALDRISTSIMYALLSAENKNKINCLIERLIAEQS